MAVTYRILPDEGYYATLIKRFWRQRPIALRPAVQSTVIGVVTAGTWILTFWPQSSNHVMVFFTALSGALLFGPGSYWLLKIIIRQRLQGSLGGRGELSYHLSDDGIVFSSALSHGEVKWPLYPRAVRFPDGIMLVRPRVICWLPDSALLDASSADATAFVEQHTVLSHVA